MSVTLVLGGARSGKSRIAESLCVAPRTYIATAQAFDDEMKQRIASHVVDRGSAWTTIEAPLDLVTALREAKGDILVDCLTLWLTNLFLENRNVAAEIAALCAFLESSAQPISLVSNELGMGLVPEHEFSRRFRDAHGLMNQSLARVADCVIFTVAGLPQVLKGQWPQGRAKP